MKIFQLLCASLIFLVFTIQTVSCISSEEEIKQNKEKNRNYVILCWGLFTFVIVVTCASVFIYFKFFGGDVEEDPDYSNVGGVPTTSVANEDNKEENRPSEE